MGEEGTQPQVIVQTTPAQPWGVQIGPKEIYDKVTEIGNQVSTMNEWLRTLVEQGKDHEQRLRALEKNRWPMHLVTALIATLAFLTSIFDFRIGGKT